MEGPDPPVRAALSSVLLWHWSAYRKGTDMKFYPSGLLLFTMCLVALALIANARLGIVSTRLAIGAAVALLAIEFIAAYGTLFGRTPRG